MASTRTSIKLNSGYEMPLLGLGTWLSNPGEVGKAVEWALLNNYKLLDCAQVYGNQKEIGAALKKLFSEQKVKREDIFITSKIWNTFHSYDKALESVKGILEELQVDYLDLCLIHWPTGYEEGGELFPKNGDKMRYSDVDYLETWKAMEKMVDNKLIRSIGLSNFNEEQIQRVINASAIVPSVLQVELHSYFQQKDLVKFCEDKKIAVTSYSSLGNPSSPFRAEGDPNIFTDSIITKMGEKYHKTNAQIVLRALIHKNIAVIPKSINEARIKQNSELFDFSLNPEDLLEFENLDQNRRFLDLEYRDGDHIHFPWHKK